MRNAQRVTGVSAPTRFEAGFATIRAAGASFLQWWRDYHALVKQQHPERLTRP
jgi:hypothetical protein